MSSFFYYTIIMTSLLLAKPLWAANYSFSPSEIDFVSIVGFKGSVEAVATDKAEEMKVEFISVKNNSPTGESWKWAPTMRRVGKEVEIKIDGPVSKKDWQKLIPMNQWPEYRVRITGAAIPLKVYWREGSITLTQWPQAVETHLLEGRITSRGGKGALRASVQQGKVNIQGRKEGPIEVSGFKVDVTVAESKGDIAVRGSHGKFNLTDNEGVVSFENEQGATDIKKMKGSLSFRNGRGQVQISGVQGGVDGRNSGGSVELVYSGKGEVQLDSATGQVVVRVPKDAAPFVELISSEGDLFVPSYLNVVNSASQKKVRGRVRGKTREGTIRVSSDKADVYLR